MKRGFIFSLHSAAGLISGIFLFLISVSGSVLVFHDEIDRLEYPSIESRGDGPLLSIDSCYKLVRQQYPRAQLDHCKLPATKHDPFVITFYDSSFANGNEPMQVFLHPQDGQILKTRSGRHNFVNWFAIMHNSFHLGKKGEWLFGFFALVFLLSILTGLVLYRKNILAVLLFKKSVLKKGNLHQVVGTWALLFNLMIAITGYWMQRYVFKKEFYQAKTFTTVFKSSAPLCFSLDSALAAAGKKYPAFSSHVVYFARSSKGKTAIYGSQSSNSFIHSKDFADVIFLDSTGAVSNTAFVNEIDAASRYDIINSQIHFGQYGGLPVKIIYCLFGLSGSVLAITGFLLWLKRRTRAGEPGIRNV